MKKKIIIGLGGLVLVLVLLFFGGKFMTKRHSPEAIATYSGEAAISVKYCQPSKKERVIFGELIPYGEVWRTGANEATIFKTDKNLKFGDKTLQAGEYSVFTIPKEDYWIIIFNRSTGQWGTQYTENEDVLRIKAAVSAQTDVTEMFIISFEANQMLLTWDKTQVVVPFEVL